METISLEYHYAIHDKDRLQPLIDEIVSEVGGEQTPYWLRSGAIDLVADLEIVVKLAIFGGSASITRIILTEYLKGFFRTDITKQSGLDHRQVLDDYFSNLTHEITALTTNIQNKIVTSVRQTSVVLQTSIELKSKAISIRIPLPDGELFVVLNHEDASPSLMKNLPMGIVKAVKYLLQTEISDGDIFQLFYFHESNEWNVLLAPTSDAYGKWVDRFIDLSDQSVYTVSSHSEFIELFHINQSDASKFLVSPFHGNMPVEETEVDSNS